MQDSVFYEYMNRFFEHREEPQCQAHFVMTVMFSLVRDVDVGMVEHVNVTFGHRMS